MTVRGQTNAARRRVSVESKRPLTLDLRPLTRNPDPNQKSKFKGQKSSFRRAPDVSPCPFHGAESCCVSCAPGGTDGWGFPHRQVCGGRRPLQRCGHCDKLVGRIEWVHEPGGKPGAKMFFGCAHCQAEQ